MAQGVTATPVFISGFMQIAKDDATATKDKTEVFLQLFKERVKEIVKGVGYSAGWATQCFPTLPEGVKELGGLMTDCKNFIGITEVPEKAMKLRSAVLKVISNGAAGEGEDPKASATRLMLTRSRTVFKETMSLINSLSDTTEFAFSRLRFMIPISTEVMRVVKGVNYTATLCGCGNGVVEQIEKIHALPEIDNARTLFYMMNMARDTSYVVLALFGLGAMAAGTVASAPVMLTCLTSALTFTITGFFFERIVDPEKKGMNIPDRMIQNFRNHIVRERAHHLKASTAAA